MTTSHYSPTPAAPGSVLDGDPRILIPLPEAAERLGISRWQGSRPCWAQRLMVLGETCKMAATSADRRKVAVLGAGRGDWLCIGTSFDALGAGGASPPPAPTSSGASSSALRGS